LALSKVLQKAPDYSPGVLPKIIAGMPKESASMLLRALAQYETPEFSAQLMQQ
jgi:hypothetical protein